MLICRCICRGKLFTVMPSSYNFSCHSRNANNNNQTHQFFDQASHDIWWALCQIPHYKHSHHGRSEQGICFILDIHAHSYYFSCSPNILTKFSLPHNQLKLTGNCMKGSRPILSFDSQFSSNDPNLSHLQIIKHLMIDVFGTPRGHPKSKPFVDRVMAFYYADRKVSLS